MTPAELKIAVTKELTNGQISPAFDLLIDTFSNQNTKQSKAFLRVVKRLKASYAQTKQAGIKGLLTSEQQQVANSKTTDDLLELVEQWANDKKKPEGFSTKQQSNARIAWLVGLIALIIGVGVVFYIRSNYDPISCPEFPQESEFDILLLPFTNLAEGELRPEIPIKQRLDKLSNENDLESAASIFERFYQQDDVQFPDYDAARKIGSGCEAEMVVWGTAERLNDGIDVNAKFSFTGDASHFDLNKVQLEGETSIDTIRSVSSIAREGNITKDIEEVILAIFGIIAHEQGDFETAAKALEASSSPGDTSLTVSMLIADSYLAMGDRKNALKSYDKVLQMHPEYNLALNNRGVLLYEQGKYRKAIADFSQVIEKNPNDAKVLAARGAAYAKINNKDKAVLDIQAAKKIDPKIKVMNIQSLQVTTINPAIFTLINLTVPNDFQRGEKVSVKGSVSSDKQEQRHNLNIQKDKGTYQISIKTNVNEQLNFQLRKDGSSTLHRGNSGSNVMVTLKKGDYYIEVGDSKVNQPHSYELVVKLVR